MTQFRKEENSRIFMNFLIDYAANLKLMVYDLNYWKCMIKEFFYLSLFYQNDFAKLL